jgi:site-specific DNA-cytosine methylase
MGKGPTMMAEAGGLGGKTGLFLVPKIFQSTNRGTNKRGMKEYNGKLPCITTSKWQDNFFCVLEEFGVRRFTPVEAERAQTLPDNYTAGHSNTARYRMIGNAWTLDMVAYILNHIPEEDRV